MSNGYLVAAGADVSAAHEIGDGFGLDVIDASSIDDPDTAASALANAANVGLLIGSASAGDTHYVAVLRAIAQRLQRAQLILIDANARAALPFLPEAWPAMSLEEARARSAELVRQRDEASGADSQPPAPSPAPEAPPSETQAQAEPQADASRQEGGEVHTAATDDLAPASDADQEPAPPPASQPADEEQANADEEQAPAAPSPQPAPASPAPNAPPLGGAVPPAPPQIQQPAPMPSPPQAPAPATAAAPPPKVRGHADIESARSASAASSAPADATAFAPKKLRRGTPELVRIVVHQPKDLNAVIKAARKIDPRTEPAPSGMKIGEVALGSAIGVSLEVRGANAEGTLQRRTWRGEPIDFSFSVEADAGVKQVVLLARVFIDDAQIGVLA
ncbi:MAG: hypothetical protein JSS00_02165, partial [Proteobacteria bacterium]|nr:hypothetical protein [Pseudomonadota bacterium]